MSELRRKKVRLCYITKKGTVRFALVKVSKLAAQPLLFPMDNPFNRGRIVRQKTFEIREAE